ncbi:hypothetical protein [Streptomyces sp. NPDC055681]
MHALTGDEGEQHDVAFTFSTRSAQALLVVVDQPATKGVGLGLERCDDAEGCVGRSLADAVVNFADLVAVDGRFRVLVRMVSPSSSKSLLEMAAMSRWQRKCGCRSAAAFCVMVVRADADRTRRYARQSRPWSGRRSAGC